MQLGQQKPSSQPTSLSNGFNKSVSAFTLIEILVVLAIVSILAGLLLPGVSSAKNRSKQIGCINNLKQVALGFQMYAADNDGRLPENSPPGHGESESGWVLGNMKNRQEATNQSLIRLGKLFPYANSIGVYHCPADFSQSAKLPRVRSYSMNSWMGSRFMETNSAVSFRTFIRENELAAAQPASLWMLIDEHEATIDDGFFWVTMDDSKPFVSSPAMRHQHGYGVNFADGHVAAKKLRDPNSDSLGDQYTRINPKNSDWIQLKQMTTIR